MQEKIEIENDSLIQANSIEDENLLSGISCQTPLKDEFENYNPMSFHVSPSFQHFNQTQEGDANKSDFSINLHHLQAETVLKQNEQSFSINNQSFKFDTNFTQIQENILKITDNLNNQTYCETISEVKSTSQEKMLIKEFHAELSNQPMIGTKHLRTRSEATSFLAFTNVKPKNVKGEEKIKEDKPFDNFDNTVFQKQSEEYTLLEEIIKEDINDIYNQQYKEFDKSMELIQNYYRLREQFQNEIQNKDQTIQNLQDMNDQLNYNQTQKIDRNKLNEVLKKMEIFIVEDQDPCPVMLQKVISFQNYKQQMERDIRNLNQIIQQQEAESGEIQQQLSQKVQELENIIKQQELQLQESQYQNEILLDQLKESNIIDIDENIQQQILKLNQKSLFLNIEFAQISVKFLQTILNSRHKQINLTQLLQTSFEKNLQNFTIIEEQINNRKTQNLQQITQSIEIVIIEFNQVKKQLCSQYQRLVNEIEQSRKEFLNSL